MCICSFFLSSGNVNINSDREGWKLNLARRRYMC